MDFLTSYNLRSQEDAFCYLIECTLATVERMTGLARPQKSELERQVNMANGAIKWVSEAPRKGSRTEAVIEKFNGDVVAWAKASRESYERSCAGVARPRG